MHTGALVMPVCAVPQEVPIATLTAGCARAGEPADANELAGMTAQQQQAYLQKQMEAHQAHTAYALDAASSQ